MQIVPGPAAVSPPAPGLGRKTKDLLCRLIPGGSGRGEGVEIVAQQGIHRGVLLQGPQPCAAEDLVVDRDRQVGHGSPRNTCTRVNLNQCSTSLRAAQELLRMIRLPRHWSQPSVPPLSTARSRNAIVGLALFRERREFP